MKPPTKPDPWILLEALGWQVVAVTTLPFDAYLVPRCRIVLIAASLTEDHAAHVVRHLIADAASLCLAPA